MNLDSLDSAHIPTGIMAVAGILLLLITLKAEKFSLRLMIGAVGLGLIAGAVWWHMSRQ